MIIKFSIAYRRSSKTNLKLQSAFNIYLHLSKRLHRHYYPRQLLFINDELMTIVFINLILHIQCIINTRYKFFAKFRTRVIWRDKKLLIAINLEFVT